MKLKILLAILLVLTSQACSSAPWLRCGVIESEEVWEWASTLKHGPEWDKNGVCYVKTECQKRTWPLSDLYRNVVVCCKLEDRECFYKNNIFNKQVVPR
jgi:hypothetical protein